MSLTLERRGAKADLHIDECAPLKTFIAVVIWGEVNLRNNYAKYSLFVHEEEEEEEKKRNMF